MYSATKNMLTWTNDEIFILDILTKPDLCKAFYSIMKANMNSKTGISTVDAWIKSQNYQTSLENFQAAAANVTANSLLAWSGIYATSDNVLITIIGDPQDTNNSLVFVNLSRIQNFTFTNHVLQWTSSNNNQNSGTLSFSSSISKTDRSFNRNIIGKIWANGSEPNDNNVNATELNISSNPLNVWISQYATEVTQDGLNWTPGPKITISSPQPGDSSNQLVVMFGEQKINNYTFTNKVLKWDNNTLNFSIDDSSSGEKLINGKVNGYWSSGNSIRGMSVKTYTVPFRGQYIAQSLVNNNWTTCLLYFDDSTFKINSVNIPIDSITFCNGLVTWSNIGGDFNSGSIQFMIDSITGIPNFLGYVWNTGNKPSRPNFRGSFSPKFIQSWSGIYKTKLGQNPGQDLTIKGAPPPAALSILYGTQTVPSYTFFNSELKAMVDSSTHFDINFMITTSSLGSGDRSFSGTLTNGVTTQDWSSISLNPDINSWIGQYQTSILDSYNTFIPNGPNLTIEKNGDNFNVILMQGSNKSIITNPTFKVYSIKNIEYQSVSWANNKTALGGQYANAYIYFFIDQNNSQLTFQGNYWGQGKNPPTSGINWNGTIPNIAPQPPTNNFPPWVLCTVVGIISFIGVVGAALGRYCWISRSGSRMTAENGTEQEMQELMKCKQE